MTEKKKPKIGVIGVGILGDTIGLYYKKAMYQVFCLDVMMDGYRGFNGACLPKDSEAFLVWAEENGINLSVLRQSVEYNSALLESQNIKKDS